MKKKATFHDIELSILELLKKQHFVRKKFADLPCLSRIYLFDTNTLTNSFVNKYGKLTIFYWVILTKEYFDICYFPFTKYQKMKQVCIHVVQGVWVL